MKININGRIYSDNKPMIVQFSLREIGLLKGLIEGKRDNFDKRIFCSYPVGSFSGQEAIEMVGEFEKKLPGMKKDIKLRYIHHLFY